MALSLPFSDWQFWVATLIAGAALFWLLKDALPIRRGARRRRRSERRATLTVDGKPVEK